MRRKAKFQVSFSIRGLLNRSSWNPIEWVTFFFFLRKKKHINVYYVLIKLNLALLHLFKCSNFIYVICTKFPHLFPVLHTLHAHHLNCEIFSNADCRYSDLTMRWECYMCVGFWICLLFTCPIEMGKEKKFKKKNKKKEKIMILDESG